MAGDDSQDSHRLVASVPRFRAVRFGVDGLDKSALHKQGARGGEQVRLPGCGEAPERLQLLLKDFR